MSDITQKPQRETPVDAIKGKEYRAALLTQLERFTSKEVSELCKNMDETLLERTNLMCERITNLGAKPLAAVQTITNLSKKTDCTKGILDSVMEYFEQSPDTWFFCQAEKLSCDVPAAKLLKSLPLVERISKWNRRASLNVILDEDHFIFLTSQIADALGDETGLERCMGLGKECVERGIHPEYLQIALLLFLKKQPTHDQFETALDELSKLLPRIDPTSYALKNLQDEVQFSTIDEFIKHLKDLNFKNDPFQKALDVKKGNVPFREFKEELRSNLGSHAGAVAFAKKISEDPEFCEFIENSLKERWIRGYHGISSHSRIMDPIGTLNDFLSKEGKSTIPRPPNGTRGFAELSKPETLTCEVLNKAAEFYPEIASGGAALETLWKNYRQQFKDGLVNPEIIKVTIDALQEEERSEVVRIYKIHNAEDADVGVNNTWVAHAYDDDKKAFKVVAAATMEKILGRWYFRSVGVDPQFEGRFIGEQLITWVSKKITGEGDRVAVELSVNNAAQERFYKDIGFEKGLESNEKRVVMEYKRGGFTNWQFG